MIVVFYGTSAELIKMLGVIQLIPRDELLLICSSQHRAGLKKVHTQLNIEPDIYLSNGWFGKDVKSITQMALMMTISHATFLRKLRPIRKHIKKIDTEKGTKSIALVHGDTLTTVIGSYMGRWLRLPVGHVEAGLRTHDWRSPFPEEIDRRIAAKFSTVHFAPSELAIADLKKENVKGEIINTSFNTAKDAIEQSAKYLSDTFDKLELPKNYCLVLLHRTELIENKTDFEKILKVINHHASKKTPVVFTEHSTTSKKIELYKFNHYLNKPGLKVIAKQPYFDFMEIVRNADCIVTDGGGLQEDAFFLGIPAIIHRKTTERQDGLGINAELSGLDPQKVATFLANRSTKSKINKQSSTISPSKIVLNYLKDHQFISKIKR